MGLRYILSDCRSAVEGEGAPSSPLVLFHSLPDPPPPHQQATSSIVWFHGDRERGNTTDARTLSQHSWKSLSGVNNWLIFKRFGHLSYKVVRLEFCHVGDPPFPVELIILLLLGQIFHIVAPLADNKSDEMGSPSARVSPTHSAAR